MRKQTKRVSEKLDSLKESGQDEGQWTLRYINNSVHLARKLARTVARGHNLFREANSFPRVKLEENCELRGTDDVQGQISERLFPPNGDYCVHLPSNIFHDMRDLKYGKYQSARYSQISAGAYLVT